jgi:hypothetical protein
MTQRTTIQQIDDNDILWRRIPDVPAWVAKEGGVYRVSSAAFKDDDDGEICVHLAKLTTKEKILEKYPENGLVEIAANLPRTLGFTVVHDPLPEDDSHALICPPSNQSKKTRLKMAKTMASAAIWVIKPKSIQD